MILGGPGGYRFSDYPKLGIPLDALVFALATLLIPMVWPFRYPDGARDRTIGCPFIDSAGQLPIAVAIN